MSKKLLFIQFPPVIDLSEQEIYKPFNFTITNHSIIQINELASLNQKYDISIFNVIVICVYPIQSRKHFIIEEKDLDELYRLVKLAEKISKKRIFVVGQHVELSNSFEERQKQVFNGYFIGKSTTQPEIDKMMHEISG